MYPIILTLHSFIRWLVLASLVFSIFRAYHGWLWNKPFLKLDRLLRIITVSVAQLQFIVGLSLYIISPIVIHFLYHFGEAVHQRDFRFFGLEHITMMLLAIILITMGAIKAKRKVGDRNKFKTMAIWFTIGLVIILISIPWPFSPFTSRPYFRTF